MNSETSRHCDDTRVRGGERGGTLPREPDKVVVQQGENPELPKRTSAMGRNIRICSRRIVRRTDKVPKKEPPPAGEPAVEVDEIKKPQPLSDTCSKTQGKKQPRSPDVKRPQQVRKITAFGSTLLETNQVFPRKQPMSTNPLLRRKPNKIEENDEKSESQQQCRPSTRRSATKMTPSKNKLTDMVDESKKCKPQKMQEGVSQRSSRSSKQPKTEGTKGPESRGREDGDVNVEKTEMNSNMSILEKLQHNIRAYFSSRTSDVTQLPEEEKAQEGEQPRTGSFHRSKTFQKNALASSATRTSFKLILEPGGQVQIINSTHGVASERSQIEEFHEEINALKKRSFVNGAREMTRNMIVQEDYLTTIVNCLPGEFGRKHKHRHHCPTRKMRPSPILRSSKSTADIPGDASTAFRHRRRTKSCHALRTKAIINSVIVEKASPDQIPIKKKVDLSSLKPNKAPFVCRKTWLVYSITETTALNNYKNSQTPRREKSARLHNPASLESALSKLGGGLIVESQTSSRAGTPKTTKQAACRPQQQTDSQGPSSSVTLKDIINLSRGIFQKKAEDNSGRLSDDVHESIQLGQYLGRLMEEKRSYLSTQKMKNARKAQTSNLIADSFNFFNVLNQEFLSTKSSDPRVEELRNVVKEQKQQKIEEYINMYRNVILTSLSKVDMRLMDETKVQLERCTDMYYDLMRSICLEKESKQTQPKLELPSCMASKPSKTEKINYYEVFKKDKKKAFSPWDTSYLDKYKTTAENSYYNIKLEEYRKNGDLDVGKGGKPRNKIEPSKKVREKCRKVTDKCQEKTKPVEETSAPHKSAAEMNLADDEPANGDKVVLKISVCDDGLIIKQMNNSEGCQKENSDEVMLSVSEVAPDTGLGSVPDKNTQSNHSLKFESDSTVYPKSSPEDDLDRESSSVALKHTAFRKLLDDSLKYLSEFKSDEDHEKGIKKLKTPEFEPGTQCNKTENKLKSDPVKEAKKVKEKDSSVQLKTSVKTKSLLGNCLSKPRLSSTRRTVVPNKSAKEIGRGKESTWWHADDVNASVSPVKSRKAMPFKRPAAEQLQENGLSLTADAKDVRKNREKKLKKKVADEESANCPLEDWQIGINRLKEMLYSNAPQSLNQEGLRNGSIQLSGCKNESIIQKTELSSGDEKSSEEKNKKVDSGSSKSTAQPPPDSLLNVEMDKLLEVCDDREFKKVADVLNHFMGNISEAWKAAICLQGLIQSSNTDDIKFMDEISKTKCTTAAQGNQAQDKMIEHFRDFLRMVAVIFEEDQCESYVRKELFLIMKETIEVCPDLSRLRQLFHRITENRSRFSEEIATMPDILKEIIARELVSDEDKFSKTEEDYEPNAFVMAVKKAGEKLKDLYADKTKQQPGKKIYHRPLRDKDDDGPLKSNLESIAMKIGQINRSGKGERPTASKKENRPALKKEKSLSEQSSIYFDARDSSSALDLRCKVDFMEPKESVVLNSIDEGYFSLNSKMFSKYRDIIYDKIINFLKSDNPSKFDYGMALLGRMMDRDSASTSENVEDDVEKFRKLLNKLIEICDVIESEVRTKIVKSVQEHGSERCGKEKKLLSTCEYLKEYVKRMKSQIEDLKPELDGCDIAGSELVQSRERNMQRQLTNENAVSDSVGQNYFLDNAFDFINSFKIFGCSLEKISSYLPNWWSGTVDYEEENASNGPELLLQSNREVVKTLRKKIEKRERRIKELLDRNKEGLMDEKVVKKVRELKRCYVMLEKMICDPTMLPVKWPKKRLKRAEESVMTLLEDVLEKAGAGSKRSQLLRYSKSTVLIRAEYSSSEERDLLLATDLISSKADDNFDGQGQIQMDCRMIVPLRPKTV